MKRHKPQQKRSAASYERMLETATTLLVAEGPEAVTSSAVSAGARLSVGAFYRFFADKQAILREVVNRHATAAFAVMRDAVQRNADQPPDVAIPRVLHALLTFYMDDPDRYLAIRQVASMHRDPENRRSLNEQSQAVLRDYLFRHSNWCRNDLSIDVAAFLIAQSVDATTHAAMQDLQSAIAAGTFETEVTHMLLSYLRGDA